MSHAQEAPLHEVDPKIASLIDAENQRQRDTLRLIPSENYAFPAVMEACGSALNNKYSEGYAGRRYYEGQLHIDAIERLAQQRVKALFGAEHANVQPYSGSPANLAIYLAFCQPGDVVMGMGLASGGHLTHGHKVAISGRYFHAIQYGVRQSDHRIDYEEAERLAIAHKPKILFCGATAYPREIDFPRFAEIAQKVGAILIADMSHIAGLVAGKVHPSPVGHAEVVTSTTHKTLRGPRGGMILCAKKHAKAIDRAVFPGLQGGPHNGTTAGIAIAARLAAQPDFQTYAQAIVANARALAEALQAQGVSLISGGTDNHLLLCDLTPLNVPGKIAATALNAAGIVCNYNAIPFDPRPPMDPSGIRLGTPALTARGMGASEMRALAAWMGQILKAPGDEALQARVAQEVKELCASFPAPGIG